MSVAQVEREGERASLVGEIRRVAEACGGSPPGARKFERITGLPRSAWLGRFWSRWSDALREAGFVPNLRNRRLEEETMLEQFAEVARSIGRIPVFSDLDLYRRSGGKVALRGAYIRHFGGKAQLLDRLKGWAEENPDRADIAAMLREEVRTDNEPASNARPGDSGAVYLLRCGSRFKIGCSVAIKKRVRAIQNTLPEPAALVHAIKTDDPLGIERYWHRRFADKRLHGEWFRLDAADVAAFRTWRRM